MFLRQPNGNVDIKGMSTSRMALRRQGIIVSGKVVHAIDIQLGDLVLSTVSCFLFQSCP